MKNTILKARSNIHRPPLIQSAGDWMHCPCGNSVSGAGFHPCKVNGAYCEPDIKWDSGWYRCDNCGQRYIDMTHVFRPMLGLPHDFHPTYPTVRHTKDEDCMGFIEDGCCIICGVGHGDTCPECGASAYHRDGCTQSDAYQG